VCLLNCFGDGSLSGDKPLVIAEDKSKKHFNSLLFDSSSGVLVTCSDGSVSRLKVERCKEYTSRLSGHLKWVGYVWDEVYWISFSGSERETRLVFGDASNKSPTQRSILLDRKAETPVSKYKDTSDMFVVRCAETKKEFKLQVIGKEGSSQEDQTKLRDEWMSEICQSTAGRGVDRLLIDKQYESEMYRLHCLVIDSQGNHWLAGVEPGFIIQSPKGGAGKCIPIDHAIDKDGNERTIERAMVILMMACNQLRLMVVAVNNLVIVYNLHASDRSDSDKLYGRLPVIVCEMDSEVLAIHKVSLNEHGLLIGSMSVNGQMNLSLINRIESNGQICLSTQRMQMSWPIELKEFKVTSSQICLDGWIWIGCRDGSVMRGRLSGNENEMKFEMVSKDKDGHLDCIRVICEVGKQVWTFADDRSVLVWK